MTYVLARLAECNAEALQVPLLAASAFVDQLDRERASMRWPQRFHDHDGKDLPSGTRDTNASSPRQTRRDA